MIRPLRWILSRVAACATRDERLDDAERQIEDLRVDLRDALARAGLAEQLERDAIARAERAEAQLARWRPVVEAAKMLEARWSAVPSDAVATSRASRSLLLAARALVDAEGRP